MSKPIARLFIATYCFDFARATSRLTFRGTKNAIKTLSGKWPQAYQKLVEDKANGTAVMNDLRDEVSGLIAIEPKGGKIARAHAMDRFTGPIVWSW